MLQVAIHREGRISPHALFLHPAVAARFVQVEHFSAGAQPVNVPEDKILLLNQLLPPSHSHVEVVLAAEEADAIFAVELRKILAVNLHAPLVPDPLAALVQTLAHVCLQRLRVHQPLDLPWTKVLHLLLLPPVLWEEILQRQVFALIVLVVPADIVHRLQLQVQRVSDQFAAGMHSAISALSEGGAESHYHHLLLHRERDLVALSWRQVAFARRLRFLVVLESPVSPLWQILLPMHILLQVLLCVFEDQHAPSANADEI